MEALDKRYADELDQLAQEIQAADELARYLEEEEEDDYNQLKELYEPRIADLHQLVAHENPLQLIAFEQKILAPEFEGLFLPKVLGYSVLRGVVNERVKYIRPQTHFKNVLLAISNSANFDILKKRIGQSIQVGFALSSDIWITNLINPISNKRVRYFLQSQKLEKYRMVDERKTGYLRYKRQFKSDNYQTATFPSTLGELEVLYPPLKQFMLHRVRLEGANNASIMPFLQQFVANKALQGNRKYLEITGLYALFFNPGAKETKELSKVFNEMRTTMPEFSELWLSFVLELHREEKIIDAAADKRLAALLDPEIKDELTDYYQLVTLIHEKGYLHEEVQEAVKIAHSQHEGLSTINDCIRQTIYQYFATFISNLEAKDYPEFFEISKVYTIYIGIFANQQFNQDIKDLCMAFVKRCLKHFTDKRGKDYQDIKKFVSTSFQDLNFLKEKEVIELFKTRRKRKASA